MPPLNRATLAFAVDQVGIAGIDAADKTVAAADHEPILVYRPASPQHLSRSAPAAVVLKPAEDPVQGPRVHRNMVKLAQSQVIEGVPMFGSVICLVETAVAADDHVPAIARIDP